MNHERPASPRPPLEPISSAMAYSGLWRIYTDGSESTCQLVVSADDGLDALERGIQLGIRDGWPLLLVLPKSGR
jgi:hypothetical protein